MLGVLKGQSRLPAVVLALAAVLAMGRSLIAAPIPVLDYNFNNDTSATGGVHDQSGNGHHGSVLGTGTTFSSSTPDGSGESLSLNGNGYVKSDTPGYTGVSGAQTLTFWEKSTSNASGVVFEEGSSTGSEAFVVTIDDTTDGTSSGGYVRIYFSTFKAAYFTNNSPNLTDGNWHFVAITVPAVGNNGGAPYPSDLGVYIDDSSSSQPVGDTNGATSHINITPNNDIQVGRDNVDGTPGVNFVGNIDDVQLFNSVLSASDITSVYNASLGVPEPTAIASIGIIGLLALRRCRSA